MIVCNSHEDSIASSSSSTTLCLPFSLLRIPSLLVLAFHTSPFVLRAHHCLTVCYLICCATLSLSLSFHKYTCALTHTLFCMAEASTCAPSITTSTYPCQQPVRAVTAGKSGQPVNDYFTLQLILSALSHTHTHRQRILASVSESCFITQCYLPGLCSSSYITHNTYICSCNGCNGVVSQSVHFPEQLET